MLQSQGPTDDSMQISEQTANETHQETISKEDYSKREESFIAKLNAV